MTAAVHMEDEMDPVRTCAGCRKRDAQDALLRLAITAEEPRLVPDVRRRLGGRGVSVHPTRACIRLAIERGGFARALSGKPKIDAATLCGMAAEQYRRRLEGLLGAAKNSRALAIGTEAVRRALDANEVLLLLVANDAAGRKDELSDRASARGAVLVSYSKKADLGRLMGRDEVSVVAVLDAGIAQEVAATAARATELSEAE